jgi:hypothetical protein
MIRAWVQVRGGGGFDDDGAGGGGSVAGDIYTHSDY